MSSINEFDCKRSVNALYNTQITLLCLAPKNISWLHLSGNNFVIKSIVISFESKYCFLSENHAVVIFIDVVSLGSGVKLFGQPLSKWLYFMKNP